jgi:hypothetical protein
MDECTRNPTRKKLGLFVEVKGANILLVIFCYQHYGLDVRIHPPLTNFFCDNLQYNDYGFFFSVINLISSSYNFKGWVDFTGRSLAKI